MSLLKHCLVSYTRCGIACSISLNRTRTTMGITEFSVLCLGIIMWYAVFWDEFRRNKRSDERTAVLGETEYFKCFVWHENPLEVDSDS